MPSEWKELDMLLAERETLLDEQAELIEQEQELEEYGFWTHVGALFVVGGLVAAALFGGQ